MLPPSANARAFLRGAARWCRTHDDGALAALVRSPFSRIAHDVGAAYATLAAQPAVLLDAIDDGRLGIPAGDREATLTFAAALRRLYAAAPALDDEALQHVIADEFELCVEPGVRVAPVDAPETRDIALARAVEPEPGVGVHGRQKHFSASSLNTYAECPRKWFYRYACAAIEDPGSSAAAYGTAFHSALEDFHAEFARPAATDEAAMRQAVDRCVTWAFERNRDGFDTAVEFELQRRRAARTAARYIDWLLAAAREAPFTVVGRETAANLELGGQQFVGFIDRLDRYDRSGSIGVVDYKTGSIATSAADYRENIRRFRDFQLPFYYWARTQAGDRVTRLALLPLKDATLDVRPIALDVSPVPASASRRSDAATGTIDVADLQRSRERMIELSGRLAAGQIEHFAVTADPSVCTYCAYAVACAQKPPALPDRFAR